MQAPADDRRFMTHALRLAARGLGRVAPNPAVGCLIVSDGEIVGRGWTQPGGRPHAEAEGLRRAGAAAKGATAYVSLEPCAHHGETPPCAEALVAAGLGRVVVAMRDPDPRTAGKGLAQLEAAGIKVVTGVLEDEAARLNRGFLLKVAGSRPLVTLKLAISLDGRIAARSGCGRWITGEAARRHGHLLRARHDAILIGRGTLEADDPSLTCRLAGLEERSPVRIVLSGRGGLPEDCAMVREARSGGPPVWLVTGEAGAGSSLSKGIERLEAENEEGGLAIASVLAALAGRGITRLLVEGGGSTAAGFLAAGCVDRLCLYRAPLVIGGDGLAAVASLAVDDIARDAPRLAHVATRPLGADRLDVYEAAGRGEYG